MKKIISFMLALLISLVPLVGCNQTEQTQGGGDNAWLTLSKSSVTLSIAGGAEIIASYENIDDITWSNSNGSVLKMTEHGNYVKVTAIGAGNSVVTASGGGKTATCLVMVEESAHVLNVTVDRVDDVNINVNGNAQIPASAYYMGERLEDVKIVYEVKDQTIATVSATGEVKGVKAGETEVYVHAEYNGIFSPSQTVKVFVKSGPALMLSATSFTLYEPNSVVNAEFFPNKADFNVYIVDGEGVIENLPVNFENSNPQVATYINGKVKALRVGETMITATCTYGGVEYVGYLYIEVLPVPDVQLTLNKTETTLFYNPASSEFASAETLVATLTVNGTLTEAQVSWKVEQGNTVVSVNENGTVRANNVGKAIVSASYYYMGTTYQATCEIEVISNVAYRPLVADVDKDGVTDINTELVYVYLKNTTNEFTISNVDLTTTHDLDLIRFGAPNYGEGGNAFRFHFKVVDVNNPDNWITFIVGMFANGAPGGILSVAMNASTWDLGSMIGLAQHVRATTTLSPMKAVGGRSDAHDGVPSGETNDRTGFKPITEHTQKDYARNMVGFSVVNDEIHFNYLSPVVGWQRESGSVFSKENQATLLASGTQYANPVFDGFTKNNVTKVNITVTVQMHDGSILTPIIIDTIGGQRVTANSVSNISVVKK